jgi:hypothetical protein
MEMRYFIAVVPCLLAILLGSCTLLTLLAWASLQDPRVEGLYYYHAVLMKLFAPRAVWRTLVAVGVIEMGLVPLAWAVFLTGADVQERKQAIPAFWAVVGGGTVAMLALLVCVNYFGLQAGEIQSISRWVHR